MLPPTDNSEQPSAVLPPELSPLTNPVLGRNMGRWAEVYFTNPPEKREQAVLELLRELEAGETKSSDWVPDDSRSQAAQNNFQNQAGSFRSEAAPEPLVDLDLRRTRLDRLDDDRPFAAASLNDWHQYRAYVWIVLAAVLLIFAAATWRRSATNAPRPSAQQTSPHPASVAPAAAAPTLQSPQVTAKIAHSVEPKHTQEPPLASPAVFKPEAPQKNPAPATPGSAELATAQDYLKGTNGQERNSAEAATWLWKSVGKRNAEATLLLADLYLKGDGVAKSCDQARVLLDAAARKGKTGAADRLRHLQAFGCE